MGNGLHCQLGMGQPVFQVRFPQKIPRLIGINIIKYACGDNYSLALSADGNIYGWGDANYGKLGKKIIC